MAATDMVKVVKVYTDTTLPGNPTNKGVVEDIRLDDFLKLLPAATAAGQPTTVTRTAAPAAAPVPFADLTAAANSFNALRTALINAGVLI